MHVVGWIGIFCRLLTMPCWRIRAKGQWFHWSPRRRPLRYPVSVTANDDDHRVCLRARSARVEAGSFPLRHRRSGQPASRRNNDAAAITAQEVVPAMSRALMMVATRSRNRRTSTTLSSRQWARASSGRGIPRGYLDRYSSGAYFLYTIGVIGEPDGIRTHDLLIKSRWIRVSQGYALPLSNS